MELGKVRSRHPLFAVALILSLQLPAVYGSAVFLLSLILFAASGAQRSHGNGLRISPIHLVIAFLFLFAHFLGNLPGRQTPPEIIGVLHGSLYLMILVSLRGHVNLVIPEKTIALITVVNLLMLAGSPIPIIQEIAFVEKVNGTRFRSYFSEPASAAIVFCIHIMLMSQARSQSLRYFVLIASSVMTLFTFSGTGIVLLFVALFQWQTAKWLIPIGLGLVAAMLIFGFVLPSQVDSIVLSRAERILSNDLSNSSFLRFAAPLLVLGDAFQDFGTLMTGIGIGNLSDYLLSNWSLFHYMRDFAGNRVDVLNNGYSIILVLLGLPLGLALIAFLARQLATSPASAQLKMFFALLPFFTGAVWSSGFWFPFFLAAGMLSFSHTARPRRPLRPTSPNAHERDTLTISSAVA